MKLTAPPSSRSAGDALASFAKRKKSERDIIVRTRSRPRVWMETCSSILTQGAKIETPVLNEFQREVEMIYRWCRDNDEPCRIVIVKPRRKGSSTISLGLCYTHLRNYFGYGAILGDDLGTTEKLLEIWDRYALSDKFGYWGNSLGGKSGTDTREFSHGSKIYSETANDPRAGMSGDIHFLIATEAAHYRRGGKASGEIVMNSIMNSVPPLPGTCVILESTPFGANGVFYKTYQSAVSFEDFKAGKKGNGFIKVFAPWYIFENSRKAITQAEADHIMNTLDQESKYHGERELVEKHGVTPDKLAWRRARIDGPECSGDPSKFDQEMPRDDVSCFLRSGTGVFDEEGLAALELDVLTRNMQPTYGVLEMPEGAEYPVFRETPIHEAWLRIWEKPREGARYIEAADFMRGKQASGAAKETDCHAGGVMRAMFVDNAKMQSLPPRVVAAIMPDDRNRNIDIHIQRLTWMAKYYGDCFIAPEVNLHGDAGIALFEQHGARIWNRTKKGKGVQVPGFDTNVMTRKQILTELNAAIREQDFECFCERMVFELRNFMTHPDGSQSAGEGAHDDWVITLAILIHLLPAATTFDSPATKAARNNARVQQHMARRESANRRPSAEYS